MAKNIAEYLGLPYFSEEEKLSLDGRSIYYVPPTTQVKEQTTPLGIETPQDFYGLTIENINQVGKAVLHESISKSVPGFYSSFFARAVKDLVLPGVTVFSREDLGKGFELLKKKGLFSIRLKPPDKSDGHGQHALKDIGHLKKLLVDVKDEEIVSKGLILEVNLKEAKTISVGFATLGKDTFSFIALQKNDIAKEDGRNRYLGAHARIVRGEMQELTGVVENEVEQSALETSIKFYDKYRLFNPIASRLSFDFLYGYDSKGNLLSGVTDITGRLGGTCPAITLSALEFKNHPSLSAIRSEVSLNYSPKKEEDFEKGAVRFIDLPSLRLSARINSKK